MPMMFNYKWFELYTRWVPLKYTGRSFNLCVTICFTTSAVVSRAFIISI